MYLEELLLLIGWGCHAEPRGPDEQRLTHCLLNLQLIAEPIRKMQEAGDSNMHVVQEPLELCLHVLGQLGLQPCHMGPTVEVSLSIVPKLV